MYASIRLSRQVLASSCSILVDEPPDRLDVQAEPPADLGPRRAVGQQLLDVAVAFLGAGHQADLLARQHRGWVGQRRCGIRLGRRSGLTGLGGWLGQVATVGDDGDLDGFAEVVKDVPAIGDWDRVRRAGAGAA